MQTRADRQGLTASWQWHHSGLVVADLDSAIEFYRDNFGYTVEFEVRSMADQFSRIVGVPGIECDLAQLVSPLSEVRLELIAVRGLTGQLSSALPIHVGVGHTAYVVDDLDAAIAAVIAAGGALLGEIVAFDEGPAAYCSTAVGTVVELEARHASHLHEHELEKR